jgi:CHASE3 domain sensor protein
MPLSLRNKINIPIGLALAILAIIGMVSYQNVTRLDDSAHWVDHTHDVLRMIEAVKATIEEAKNSQRGYVISGSESYLSSYAAAKQNVLKMLADLRRLTSDNPGQQKRLDALASLITARMASLDHTITVRSQQGFGPAAKFVGSDSARLLTDETDKAISEMEQAERVLLKERDVIEKHSVRNTKLVILLGSLLAFSIVPIAALITNREIQKRAVAEREIISKTEKLATSERESRRKSQILQSVLDSMGDGVAVADEKGDSQPPGFCFSISRRQHRDRRVIGVQLRRTHHVTSQLFYQRRQQLARAAHPVRQRRAFQLHAFPRIHCRLAIQR